MVYFSLPFGEKTGGFVVAAFADYSSCKSLEPEQKAAVKEANDICHGQQCCDGNHDQWIDNLPYCQQLESEGKCGGCFKFQVDPSPDTLFCCRKHYAAETP